MWSVYNRILESLFQPKMMCRSQSCSYYQRFCFVCFFGLFFVFGTSFPPAFLNEPSRACFPSSVCCDLSLSLSLASSQVKFLVASALYRISILTICTMKSSKDSISVDEVRAPGAHYLCIGGGLEKAMKSCVCNGGKEAQIP